MTITDEFPITIHLVLRKLIEEKSRRDNINFTGCQLAHAIGMPRSIITKLTHPDVNKRVTNPRIDTLIKIIEFFKADGFNITLEDLLGIETKTVNVKSQFLSLNRLTNIPVYLLDNLEKKVGHVEMKISSKSKDIIGICSSKDIKPFFKAGSIFIIDPNAKLENDVLVAVKPFDSSETQIRKYNILKNRIVLKSLDANVKDKVFMPKATITIIGVIIQVNAKT